MKRWMGILLALLWLHAPVTAAARPADELIIKIQASPAASHVTSYRVKDAASLARQILNGQLLPARGQPELPRARIVIGKREYVLDSLSRLYDARRNRQVLLTAEALRRLEMFTSQAEAVHYGRPLVWEQVRQSFRRMSYGTVVDMETGESFRVQRRAGSRHADVQPVTSADTKTMKRIYQGEWSWRRRAILLIVGDKRYAASMNGMPHGAGAIAGNDFPGHFCIHFAGSTTHQRRQVDPGHQLMVQKSSGTLRQAILQAEPTQLVHLFLTALHEQDLAALRMTTNGCPLPFHPEAIETFSPPKISEPGESAALFAAEVPVTIDYLDKRRGRQKERWIFTVSRSSPLERWVITGVDKQSHS